MLRCYPRFLFWKATILMTPEDLIVNSTSYNQPCSTTELLNVGDIPLYNTLLDLPHTPNPVSSIVNSSMVGSFVTIN